MLPYEPLIKIVHSEIKCYDRKTKKKTRSGETHTYTSKQYVVPLKNHQPFTCNQEVTIIKRENFFRINDLLNQRKKEYDENLERIISLENEIKTLKAKLKNYEDLDIDLRIKKFDELEYNYDKLMNKFKIKQNQLSTCTKDLTIKETELSDYKKELETKDKIIGELKGKNVFGKISGLFSDKKSP